MLQAYSDRGIIVRIVDSGEADKYLTLVTESHGLENYIARGARRSTSKKSSHLDLFNVIKFQTGRGDNPLFINQAESDHFFPRIKQDYTKVTLCLSILEILSAALPAGQSDPEMFLSLLNFLKKINQNDTENQDKEITQKFSHYLLRHLGYPPPTSNSVDSLSSYFETILNKKIISKEMR